MNDMDGMVILLDKSFEAVKVIDTYESFIWTLRYREPGEFELYMPLIQENVGLIEIGSYIYYGYFYNQTTDTAQIMIVETIEMDDQHIKYTGRCLKSILDYRICWGQKTVAKDTNVQTAVSEVISENITSPELTERTISNFIFNTVSGTFKTVEEDIQYNGETLLSILSDLTDKYDFGYDIVYNFTSKKFTMSLTVPIDRTFDQTAVPPVVFSSEYDNLKSSKYIESIKNYKNVAYISGERYSDDEIDKFHQNAILGDAIGIDRRELFVDASSITHELEDGTIYGSTSYQQLIEQEGQRQLAKEDNAYTKTFEGEANGIDLGFKYGVDYKIGDIVEIRNDYGMSSPVRVVEIVLNVSSSGITVIPTFEAIRSDDND